MSVFAPGRETSWSEFQHAVKFYFMFGHKSNLWGLKRCILIKDEEQEGKTIYSVRPDSTDAIENYVDNSIY